MSLPKPMMRGMLAKRLRLHLPLAFALSIGCAIVFKERNFGIERFTCPDRINNAAFKCYCNYGKYHNQRRNCTWTPTRIVISTYPGKLSKPAHVAVEIRDRRPSYLANGYPATDLKQRRYTVTEPRKKAYAEFYKHYDAAKDFEAMREAGIFESVRPSGE